MRIRTIVWPIVVDIAPFFYLPLRADLVHTTHLSKGLPLADATAEMMSLTAILLPFLRLLVLLCISVIDKHRVYSYNFNEDTYCDCKTFVCYINISIVFNSSIIYAMFYVMNVQYVHMRYIGVNQVTV